MSTQNSVVGPPPDRPDMEAIGKVSKRLSAEPDLAPELVTVAVGTLLWASGELSYDKLVAMLTKAP